MISEKLAPNSNIANVSSVTINNFENCNKASFSLPIESQELSVAKQEVKPKKVEVINIDKLPAAPKSVKKKLKETLSKPDEVKKPISPYFLFCMDRRPSLKQTYNTTSNSEIAKILSKEWHCLTPSQKLKYELKNKEMRERYNNYKYLNKKSEEVIQKQPESIYISEKEESKIDCTENKPEDAQNSVEDLNRIILTSFLSNPGLSSSDISRILEMPFSKIQP